MNRKDIHSSSFHNELIAALKRVQAAANAYHQDSHACFADVLKEFLELTSSQYGFLAEVDLEDMVFKYLHLIAHENQEWDDQLRAQYQQKLKSGINFRNPSTLLSRIASEGVIVVNDAEQAQALLGTWPEGHPPIQNCIILPVNNGKTLNGLIVLANRDGAYFEKIYEQLEVILQFVGHLIEDERIRKTVELTGDNEGYYQNLIASMPGAVSRMQINDDLFFIDVSHQIEGITGYHENEFLGTERISYAQLIIDEERDAVIEQIRQAVACDKSFDIEYRIKTKDGGECWVLHKGYGLYLEDGSLCYLSCYLMDINEHKRLREEQRLVNERLLQAQQMQTIGQMAGGIAHDFNNMLASMMGYAELCMELISEGETDKIPKYLQQIFAAGERARDVVARMEAFSKGQGGNDDAFCFATRDLFDELAKILYVTLPKTINIHFDAGDAVPAICFDPVAMQQIIISVCMNASEAMDEHGDLYLSATDEAPDQQVCASCHQVVAGQYVKLSVQDTGRGMDSQQLERIFDPFYTSKQMGNGAGMGLSAVHGVLHKYGGHITVESRPASGSTFNLYIPVDVGCSNSKNKQA